MTTWFLNNGLTKEIFLTTMI